MEPRTSVKSLICNNCHWKQFAVGVFDAVAESTIRSRT